MRVPDGLGELTDHVEADLGSETLAVHSQVGLQPQVVGAMAEEDRRARLVLANLHGLGDAAMGDALQDLVLAARSALYRLPPLVGRLLSGEVELDPPLLANDTRPFGQAVLPGGTRIEQVGAESPVVAEAQVRGGRTDSDLLQQLRQNMPRKLRRDPLPLLLRRSGQQVAPQPRQPF